MDRQQIISDYANDLYDSIDFLEYVMYKIDYSKKERKILFELERDRRIKNDEYLEIAEEVADEFKDVVRYA